MAYTEEEEAEDEVGDEVVDVVAIVGSAPLFRIVPVEEKIWALIRMLLLTIITLM